MEPISQISASISNKVWSFKSVKFQADTTLWITSITANALGVVAPMFFTKSALSLVILLSKALTRFTHQASPTMINICGKRNPGRQKCAQTTILTSVCILGDAEYVLKVIQKETLLVGTPLMQNVDAMIGLTILILRKSMSIVPSMILGAELWLLLCFKLHKYF